MNRAYSILEVREISEDDDDERIIRGVATTPTPDRYGDIVDPMGVKFNNPLPLLHQHDSRRPVGTVKFDKPTKAGITFEARVAKVMEPGQLKDRVDLAWQEVKAGLVRAVSIGFRVIEYAFIEATGGVRYDVTEILELSLVTVPANADCTISQIKSIDRPLLAASGKQPLASDRPVPPGVSGTRTKNVNPVRIRPEEGTKMTLAEQIAQFEAKRASNYARMEAIQTKATEEGRGKSEEERDEFDTLREENKSLDAEIKDLRDLETTRVTAARPATGATERSAAESRSLAPITLKRTLPAGTRFARMVGALAASRGNRFEAAEFAKRWHDSSPEVEAVLRMPMDIIEKAAVSAGTTTDSTWAAPLVQYQDMASEFIDYLRPMTIIGRISGFRRVPFKIRVPRQTGAATVGWVGEAKVKPLTSLAFDSLTLDFTKIAGIIPLSEELVRFSSPSAEELVRADLAAAITQFMDREFIDPTKAEASTVSPASITYGVTPVAASGTTAAALRLDVKNLFSSFLTAGVNVSSGVWIMTQTQALAISLMQNALGQPEFPGITMNGGTFMGFPVVASENVPSTGGSPTDGYPIIFAVAGEIMLADDGGVAIDMSREASLQMETAPDSPASASTVLVSLWQHNMVAIKAERFINWKKRRDTAVGYIAYAKYAE